MIGKGRQNALARLDQYDARIARIDAEVPGQGDRASSAMAPASSTPVGPAPITAKVSSRRRAVTFRRFRALECNQDPPADPVASSICFRPGAHLPRRRGRNMRAARPWRQRARRTAPGLTADGAPTASIAVTRPSSTRMFRRPPNRLRIGVAMSAGDTRPWPPGRATAETGGDCAGRSGSPQPDVAQVASGRQSAKAGADHHDTRHSDGSAGFGHVKSIFVLGCSVDAPEATICPGNLAGGSVRCR